MTRTSRGDLNYVGDTEGHPDAPANRTDVSPPQQPAPLCPYCDVSMKVHPDGVRWFCMAGHATGWTTEEVEAMRVSPPQQPEVRPVDGECPTSQRVDGKFHSWCFDGDDPYIICAYCDERRDALTGRVVRAMELPLPHFPSCASAFDLKDVGQGHERCQCWCHDAEQAVEQPLPQQPEPCNDSLGLCVLPKGHEGRHETSYERVSQTPEFARIAGAVEQPLPVDPDRRPLEEVLTLISDEGHGRWHDEVLPNGGGDSWACVPIGRVIEAVSDWAAPSVPLPVDPEGPRGHAALSLAADGRWTGDRDSLRRQLAIIEDEAARRVVAEIRERLLGDSAPVDALYERYTRAILDDIAADTAGSREANRIPHTPPRSLEEELDRIEATYPVLDALSAAHDKEGKP